MTDYTLYTFQQDQVVKSKDAHVMMATRDEENVRLIIEVGKDGKRGYKTHELSMPLSEAEEIGLVQALKLDKSRQVFGSELWGQDDRRESTCHFNKKRKPVAVSLPQ